MPSPAVTKRLTLAGLSAALTAACSPLSLFATLSPKDPASAAARAQAYGANPRQRLDVYAPRGAKGDAPLAVFFYGGSWDSGRRQDYNWVGKALASRGFVTVIADYRLYPEVKYPDFLATPPRPWWADNAARFGGDPTRSCSWAIRRALQRAMLALTGATCRPRAGPGREGAGGAVGRTISYRCRATSPTGSSALADLPATQPMAYVIKARRPPSQPPGRDDMVWPKNTWPRQA